MKTLKALFVLALVAFFAAPAFAETQNVKVSGSIDAYWFYRSDFDLRENNDIGSINTLNSESVSNPSTNHRSDVDNYFMSITQIQVAAELTSNVSTVVNLVNQRDWNADAFGVAGTSGTAAETSNNEFDVTLDLAYVQLKEAFYSPLTLTIGRQDLFFGRGFMIGWNPQDPQSTIEAEEYTAIQSFDAIRATLDFNPWTIDVVYSKILENASNSEDDKDLWISNINYKFSEYNAVAEGYFVAELDKATLSASTGTFNNDTYTVGGRVQFDPISQITLGAELAFQGGEYISALGNPKRERDAWAWDLFGTYRFDNVWKPEVTLEYVHMGGESNLSSTTSDDFGSWNNAFRGPTYGRIHEYLETYNSTISTSDQATSQNLDLISLTGSLKPMDDLMLSLTWYYFWSAEDAHVTIASPSSAVLNDSMGHEFDATVTYAYTEDVTFLVYADWFIPGDYYNSPNDATAAEVVSGVKVAF